MVYHLVWSEWQALVPRGLKDSYASMGGIPIGNNMDVPDRLKERDLFKVRMCMIGDF